MVSGRHFAGRGVCPGAGVAVRLPGAAVFRRRRCIARRVKGVARWGAALGARDIPVTVISPAASEGWEDAFSVPDFVGGGRFCRGVPAALRVLLRGLVSPGWRRVLESVPGDILLNHASEHRYCRDRPHGRAGYPNAVSGFRPDPDSGASSIFGIIGRCLRSSPCRRGGFVRRGGRFHRGLSACRRMVQPAVSGPAGRTAHGFGLRSGVSVFVRDVEECDLVLAFCDEVVFRSG